MIQRFIHEEEGQTLVEYGLLLSLIALIVIGVLNLMGRKVSNTFNTVEDYLPGGNKNGPPGAAGNPNQ